MLALTALFIFLTTATLILGLSGRQKSAQASIDGRLLRAKGLESHPIVAAPGSALRTNPFAKSGGLGRKLAGVRSMQVLGDLIEKAGWRLSVVEFLAVSLVIGAVALLAARARLPVAAIPAGIIGMLLPLFFLRRAVKKRRSTFITQLVDALALVSNALKAGVGLMQALDQAAEQMKPPFSEEMKRTLHDINMGAAPDEAFADLNDRLHSDDLDIVITAITVQRSTGGNLAEILDKVAETMRERIRIRGEIKTLTTQQQFSGYMIAAMPIGLLLFFNLMNHSYVAPLFDTTAGNVVLGFGGMLQLVGILVIRKIVNIEV